MGEVHVIRKNYWQQKNSADNDVQADYGLNWLLKANTVAVSKLMVKDTYVDLQLHTVLQWMF